MFYAAFGTLPPLALPYLPRNVEWHWDTAYNSVGVALKPTLTGSPRGARPLLLVGFVLLPPLLLQPGLTHPVLLPTDSVLPNLVGSARLYTVGQDSEVLVRKAQECGCPVPPASSSPRGFRSAWSQEEQRQRRIRDPHREPPVPATRSRALWSTLLEASDGLLAHWGRPRPSLAPYRGSLPSSGSDSAQGRACQARTRVQVGVRAG